MTWFLVVYDRRAQRPLDMRTFAAGDGELALEARRRAIAEYLRNPDIEVVLLGAESEGDVRATHGRYFEDRDPRERSQSGLLASISSAAPT